MPEPNYHNGRKQGSYHNTNSVGAVNTCATMVERYAFVCCVEIVFGALEVEGQREICFDLKTES